MSLGIIFCLRSQNIVFFTVKLKKTRKPEVFMEYYCVARKKSINCEKIKPQTGAVTVINCGFEFFRVSWTLFWLVWYTINLSESNQSVHGVLSFTEVKRKSIKFLIHCPNSRVHNFPHLLRSDHFHHLWSNLEIMCSSGIICRPVHISAQAAVAA